MNGEHFGSEKSNQSYRKHIHKIQTKEAKLQRNQNITRDPLSVTGECAKCLVHHGCSEYSQPVKKYRKYRSITNKQNFVRQQLSSVHQLTGTWQNFESFSLVLSRRGCHIQEQSISAANMTKLASIKDTTVKSQNRGKQV